MEEKEKPFDTVSIVILVLLALGNDGAEIFFDLLAATVVGLPGEAIMEPINLGMDGIFTFWFFAKCGFGGPAMIQIADDLLSLVGVPGRTICVVAGILIANNPKLAAVAEVAGATALTGGAGAVAGAGEAAEAGTAVEGAATAAKSAEAGANAVTEVESAESNAQKTIHEAGGEQRASKENEEEKSEEETERKLREEEAAKKMLLGAEITPEEQAQQEIFGKVAQEEEKQDENEQIEQSKQGSSVVSINEGRKASETKREQQKPHAPKIIDLREEDKAA